MNKAELKTDEQTKQTVLFVDEKPQFCGFKTPQIMQTNLGGVNILNFSCGTSCPLFKVEKNCIALHCGCEKVIYTLIDQPKLKSL
jgi:hypothetical protein